MKYIVIGATSSIGKVFKELLEKKKIKSVGTYSSNNNRKFIKFDITKDQIIKKINSIKKKDIVLIFSAITNHYKIIKHKILAEKINVKYTKKLIKDLSTIGCKIIFISSVEVFDGKKGNYLENHKKNPLSTYGKHKSKIENFLIRKIKKNFTIIRLSWTVDSSNENSRDIIYMTYHSILKKNSRMAFDNYFNITDVTDVCEHIIKASKKKIKILHLVSKEIISRYDLARLIKKISKKGKKMHFKKIKFKDFPYSEPRARLNYLKSKYTNIFPNKKYKPITDIVLEKVKVMDGKNYE
jgi:dTDP-4-dehydrorhamnose reductase